MANDLLVRYLESIDKHLLDYLNEDEDLSDATTQRLLSHTTDLLAGAITPAGLATTWRDWFDLVSAFVITYGSADLEELEEMSGFGPGTEPEADGPPTGLVRGFLLMLELELDLYPQPAT